MYLNKYLKYKYKYFNVKGSLYGNERQRLIAKKNLINSMGGAVQSIEERPGQIPLTAQEYTEVPVQATIGEELEENIFKILNFKYYDIDEGIVTSGRNCKTENAFGIRPKMSIIFSMPNYIYKNKQNIIMTSIASKEGKELSFSTIKYNYDHLVANYDKHPGGRSKFENERRVWLNLTEDVQILASTYRFIKPDADILGNSIFEIDFYPCRFLLKAGISHDKLYVEIKPESEITSCNELCNEIIGSNWNTYDEYFNKRDKLKQKLLNLPEDVSKILSIAKEGITLDPSSSNTLEYIEEH